VRRDMPGGCDHGLGAVMDWNKDLSYVNVDLGLLNWLVIPVKVIIYIISSAITRAIEPYQKPKTLPEIDYKHIEVFADQTALRLLSFRYNGYTLSSFRGQRPNGTNHDDGDWCLMASTLYAWRCVLGSDDVKKRSDDFIEIARFIDDDGRLSRGWKWGSAGAEDLRFKYNISGDQIAGFAFALSLTPRSVLIENKAKIIKFIDGIVNNRYLVPDPEGRSYWRDYRMGVLAYGGMVPTIMALLRVAWSITENTHYLKEYNRFLRRAAALAVMFPFGTLADAIQGYVWNVTMIALAALQNMQVEPKWWIKCGIKWVWWINRRHYNPFWTLLASRYVKIPREDIHHAVYQLSTVSELDYTSFEMSAGDYTPTYGAEPIKARRWFGICGRRYTTLPPRYSEKVPDDFLFQRTERMTSNYGKKFIGTEDWRYNMAYYLLTEALYRVERSRRQ